MIRGRATDRTPDLEASTSVAADTDGTLRLVVIADTHSTPHPGASKHIKDLRPRAILHAGDIGDLRVLRELETIAPVLAVRGNIDPRQPDLPDLLDIDLTHDDRLLSRLLLLHIAVDGPRLRADIGRMARARSASLVICGHSHVPLIATDRELTVFNPGSAGPRRFHLPILFGTIDVSPTEIRLAHFECETGRRWTPRSA